MRSLPGIVSLVDAAALKYVERRVAAGVPAVLVVRELEHVADPAGERVGQVFRDAEYEAITRTGICWA